MKAARSQQLQELMDDPEFMRAVQQALSAEVERQTALGFAPESAPEKFEVQYKGKTFRFVGGSQFKLEMRNGKPFVLPRDEELTRGQKKYIKLQGLVALVVLFGVEWALLTLSVAADSGVSTIGIMLHALYWYIIMRYRLYLLAFHSVSALIAPLGDSPKPKE